MPELPEVETVRRGLEPVLAGARLTHVRQNRPDLRFPFPDRFPERLDGAVVERIDRRAKYLLMPLSTGETWVTHLGMTGRFTLDGTLLGEFEEAAPIAGKHEHFSGCAIRDGAATRIGYADARRFGFMGLIPSDQVETHPWFAGLGPEPLGNGFSGAHLAEVFAGRKPTIKVSLLDQRHVAGLGNIYVCEALYRARISPLVAAGKVPGKDFLCTAAPGTAESFTFNVDSFAMFQLRDKGAQQAQADLASALMSADFQEVFNLNKGSIPVRLNMDLAKFDDCAKSSAATFVESAKSGALVPSVAHGMAVPAAAAGALQDAVSQFWNDDKMSVASAQSKIAAAAKIK